MAALFLFVVFSGCISAFANDSLEHAVLLRLNDLQVHHEPYFPPGLYPCYRQYSRNLSSIKNDDNIFFTGLIGFTLRRIRPSLSPVNQLLCDSILERIKPVAAKFINQKGRGSYNFWTTDTLKIFPNSGWINLFNKTLALADDFDDTSIMLLALNKADSEAAKQHAIMQSFTNHKGKTAKTTLNDYKQYNAYSIWYGKKMVIELDACVLCNTLYMVQKYNLQWTKADSASMDFLVHMIEKKDYLNHPDKIAVYYKRSSIILYHIARLMHLHKFPELEQFKPKLIQDALTGYAKTSDLMDRVILRTALLFWGTQPPAITMLRPGIISDAEQDDFVFFIANLACTMPKPIAFTLFDMGITRFYFRCPAYNDALLLESLVEQRNFDEKTQ